MIAGAAAEPDSLSGIFARATTRSTARKLPIPTLASGPKHLASDRCRGPIPRWSWTTLPMNLPAAHSTLDTIYTRYDGLRGFGDTTGKIFEAIITSLYRILLQPGDVAFDLGACTGLHTVPLGQCVGPRGLVVAFEPLPDCRTRLEANCRSAGVLPQVQIKSTALSKQKGTATFFAVGGNVVGHSGLRKKPNYPDGIQPKEITVETAPVDDFLPSDRKVRFLKADLEGGEFHALQGGRKLMGEHRPVLAIESALAWDAKQFGYTQDEFFAFFREFRYELKDILGCPFGPTHSSRVYPHYLICYPQEQATETTDALTMAVLSNTVGPAWFGITK